MVNLIVQAILNALGEAEDPDLCDYYELNKKNSDAIHLDADSDPEQVELDTETFKNEGDVVLGDELTLEEKEKEEAMSSPLKKVRSWYSTLTSSHSLSATIHYH